jgi:hypothetical protein
MLLTKCCGNVTSAGNSMKHLYMSTPDSLDSSGDHPHRGR